jgi:60 kDa SS-A/Ro ribonucleoprotein
VSTYSSILNNTTQTQPIFGRTDMVKNNAGGYVFKVSNMEQFERFLLLGTIGGTYYVSEQKLTQDNCKVIVDLIKSDGLKVLSILKEYAKAKRILKYDTALFTLALFCTFGNEETKKQSYKAIKDICITGTHILTFVSEVNNMRGWSAGLRKGVAAWYNLNSNLAYQITKYQNRAGFTHRDVLRLSHAKAIDNVQNSIFKFVTKGSVDESTPELIKTFIRAKNAESISDTVTLIENGSLTWEMIKTEYLNDSSVLTALLPNMPYVALLRNLNRFGREHVPMVVSKIKDIDSLKKSGIHPFTTLNALRVYSKGHGDRSDKTWEVHQKISDALNEAVYSSMINNVESTGQSVLFAVDTSGSMSASVSNGTISCREAAALMSAISYKTEPNSELIWFDTQGYKPNFGARTSFEDIAAKTPAGGGTDCSIPFNYALTNKIKYDAFVIYTDNETWAGNKHALTYLNEYRKKINPDVKVIEVAMASNPHTQLPRDDKNILRIVGFDGSINNVINNFLKGSLT